MKAANAAKSLAGKLRKLASSAEEVMVLTPAQSEAHGWGRVWSVVWEEGAAGDYPEWAVALSLADRDSPVAFPIHGDGWYLEPWTGCVLCFQAR